MIQPEENRPLDERGDVECKDYKRSTGRKKYVKTAILIYSWICLGFYSEVLGPTLPTLMNQTGANYEQIGSALAIRAAGLLCGSLFGGLAADKFINHRPLQMCLSLFVAAAINFTIPWIRSLALLSFMLYLAGCTHGVLTTNGNPLLASIWLAQASGPFSLMHAGYGIGGAVAPALVLPFTKKTTNHTDEHSNSSGVPLPQGVINSTVTALIDPVIPFCIVGILLLVCSFCFLVFDGFGSCEGRKRVVVANSAPISDNQSIRRRFHFRSLFRQFTEHLSDIRRRTTRNIVLLVISVFVIYFAIVGNERVFGKFMFTYAIFGPIHMNASKGYLLNLLYWLFFGLARVITSLLALVIPAQALMFSVVVGTVVTSTLLIFIPATEKWFFAVSCLFSLFKSPLFPTTLAAINQSYEITGFLILLVNFGSAIGASVMQYTAGSLIEAFGQYVFPYIVFGSACVILVTAILLLVLFRKAGDRFAPAICISPVRDGVSNLLKEKANNTLSTV